MNKRSLCKIVISSLILTNAFGINGYAYQGELYIDTLETTPVSSGDLLLNDTAQGNDDTLYDTSSDNANTYDPASGNVNSDEPGGDVDIHGNEGAADTASDASTSTDVQEVRGTSSPIDDSEVNVYTGEIIDMVLPVIPEATYDFVMDPKDILSRYSINKESYSRSSLYFTNYSGGIMHRSTSDAALAINRSTVPVLLTVTLDVENPNEWPVRFTDMASVENDDEMNVSFELIPVRKLSSDISTKETELPDEIKPAIGAGEDPAEDGSAAENSTDNGTLNPERSVGNSVSGNDTGIDTADRESPFGDSDIEETQDGRVSTDENGHAELQIVIPANIDNFEKYGDGYILKEDASFTPYGWAVNGACNRRADWTDIITREKSGESIGIHITYQMKVMGAE